MEEADVVAREMTRILVAVVNSFNFNKDEIGQEKLSLAQAYCLLWQNCENGDVDGRKSYMACNAGATAAILIDLVVMGRADVEIVPNKTLGIKNDHILFKVLSEQPTGTYIDDTCIYQDIMKHHRKNPSNSKKVKDLIFSDLCQMRATQTCTTQTLESLVALGILDKEEKMFGNKYPTIKPGFEEALVRDIRAVALDNEQPSSYIHILLTLARNVDKMFLCDAPVLRKYFSKAEYGKAKERLNAVVSIDKKGKEKYELQAF